MLLTKTMLTRCSCSLSSARLIVRPTPTPAAAVVVPSRRQASTASGPPPPTPLHGHKAPHLLTLADLSISQIDTLVQSARGFKRHYKQLEGPSNVHRLSQVGNGQYGEKSLSDKTVALMFSKRSTRTRVASETSVKLLGGHPMFLGAADIQLGVNESLYDTSRVVSSMVDGIMARVGHHSEVEGLAANSAVPVINALSHLYHPTQILADIQTLLEHYAGGDDSSSITSLKGRTIAWVGDSNNILNEMMVVYPRLGATLQIATPKGYDLDADVLARVKEAGVVDKIVHTHSPEEAVKGADVITTDTWISMGQEEETARRLSDFAGYQITRDLLKRGAAKPDAVFMHCLPRHEYEVDDEVFYGKESVVFDEAENRKWTIMACFHHYFGKWQV